MQTWILLMSLTVYGYPATITEGYQSQTACVAAREILIGHALKQTGLTVPIGDCYAVGGYAQAKPMPMPQAN